MSKRTFAARTFASRTFASATWTGEATTITPPSVPGIEWRCDGERLHFAANAERPHYRDNGSRLHWDTTET